ncbi:hypothetical protein Lal_00012493 [Lupinus albus]|nr:hypothetical protein Lal_00012493 [Lupinus albus]
MIDQLSCTPTKVLLLSLVMNLDANRKVILKVLNQEHIDHDITTNKLGGIVNNIMVGNYISLSDQEIRNEGRGHTHPLHISITCKDFVIGRVLIDNSASPNVITKGTLSKLSVEDSVLRPSSTIVKAFDRARQDVLGEIELHMSWTSTRRLAVCWGDHGYIQPVPYLPYYIKRNFFSGVGDRKGHVEYGQGMENTLLSKWARLYKPDGDYEAKGAEERKKRTTHLGAFKYENRRIPIPHISQNFMSADFDQQNMIAMMNEDQPNDDFNYVYKCPPGMVLNNLIDVANSVYDPKFDNESITNDLINNNFPNFDNSVNQEEEDDNYEDWEASLELKILVD